MRLHTCSTLLVLAAGCSTALADLPASTKVTLYKNGQPVTGMGPINSPFFFSSGGAVGGTSFRGVAINNAGDTFVHCGVYAQPQFNEAILKVSQGLVPYIGAGFWGSDAGAVGVPTSDYAMKGGLGIDLNNGGTLALQLSLGQGDFGPDVTPTTGVSFDRLALVAQQGGPVTAPGIAPGATFQSFGVSNVLGVNDSNVFLIGANITESGLSRRVLLKIATDNSGVVLSTTVVAKEGGLVGGGPVTWTAVSISPNSAAINNAGQVVFSGATSAGVEGVYRDGTLVASSGGASPILNQPWGTLLGTPVDINASGKIAFRGFYGSGICTESGDAGEAFATANATTNGTLTNITGSLTNDQDVDFYRVRISDFSTFSATTVPAAGFPGSAGDTTLYLFRNFANLNGITRIALSRNDNSAGTPQSSVTGVNLPSDGSVPGEYYLAVATPKSRPVDNDGNEFWIEDPAAISISGGKIYWSDPSEGTIRRADVTTGVIDPVSYTASVVPRPYTGQIAGTGKMLIPPFVVSDSPSPRSMIWSTSAYAENRFHTADPESFADNAVTLTPPGAAAGVTGMAVDNVNGKVYWTRADDYPASTNGFLNRSNLDGSGVEVLLTTPSTQRPRHLTVDPAGGKIYWTDSVAQGIFQANLDGSASTAIVTSVTAGGIALDPAVGKVYWTVPTTGTIERANTEGSSRETFKSGLSTTTLKSFPASIAVSGDSLYYADVRARAILKMPTASLNPSATTLVSIGGNTSDTASDSPAHLSYTLGGWVRDGTPSASPIAYQVKLTGAVAYNQQAMVAMNNTVKVAAVGDSPAAIAPATFTAVGDAGGPLRISDNGLVAYRARWVSGTTQTGLFLGKDKVFDGLTVPTGNTLMGDLDAGAAGFDMSDSGQYIVAHTNRTLPNFTAQFIAAKVSFATVPQAQCPADLGVQGGIPGQDGLLDNNDFVVFIDYFFSSNPLADVGVQGGIAGHDGVFDNNDFVVFIDMFFAGCS